MHYFFGNCNNYFNQINTIMSVPETGVAKRNPDPYNTQPGHMPGGDFSPIPGSTPPGPLGVVPRFKPRNTIWPRPGGTD
jgi:hypothetical protein